MTAVVAQKVGSHILLAINKKNIMHTTTPQTNIAFIMPHPRGIGSRHNRDNRCFNFKYIHPKSNELSSMLIPVNPSLNN